MLRRSKGQYTAKQINRCAQMSGPFGKEMERIMTSSQLGHYSTNPRHSSLSRRVVEDVATFVAEFTNDGLFDCRPGRSHHGFEDFAYEAKIEEPIKMGGKMKTSVDIDSWDDTLRRRRGKTMTLHLHIVSVTNHTASFAIVRFSDCLPVH